MSAAAIALVVGAPIGIVTRMGLLDSSGVPGLDSAKSFLAMMADRSPGDRTTAELTKTKLRAEVAPPKERALGKVAKPELPKEFVAAIAPPVPTIAEVPTAPLSSIGPLLITPGVPGGGGGIFVPDTPGGGGGTPGTPGTDPEPETPPENPPTPETPAVPEPGTWATMLLGFGLTGMMIRRRRRAHTAAASA